MFRIEAVCACALFIAASGSAGAGSVHAQDSDGADAPDVGDSGYGGDGPGPVDSMQSMNAGDSADIAGGSGVAAVRRQGTPGFASGTYKGVVPGAASPAPPAAKAAKSAKAAPTITWPGFQMRPDGSSRVFVQSTTKLEPKVLSQTNGKFELQLPGARVAEKTNRLPLDTRYFNTPVTKVSVNAARSGAVVQLDLRASVTPQVSSEDGPNGYFFTYIELPKGEYLKGASGEPVAVMPTVQMGKPSSKVIGKPAAVGDVQLDAHSEPKRGVRADASARGSLKLGQ